MRRYAILLAVFLAACGSSPPVATSTVAPAVAAPTLAAPATLAPTVRPLPTATVAPAIPTPTAIAPPTPVAARPAAMTGGDNVNLRSGPTTDAGVLTVIPPGSELTVLNPDVNGWSQVSYGGKTGYVRNDLVSAAQAPSQPTAPPVAAPTAKPATAGAAATVAPTATPVTTAIPPTAVAVATVRPSAPTSAPAVTSGGCPPDKPVHVSGYTTKAGKVVAAYCRSK